MRGMGRLHEVAANQLLPMHLDFQAVVVAIAVAESTKVQQKARIAQRVPRVTFLGCCVTQQLCTCRCCAKTHARTSAESPVSSIRIYKLLTRAYYRLCDCQSQPAAVRQPLVVLGPAAGSAA